MASASGQRFVEILAVLRHELPGDWSLRGRGIQARLFREPVDWGFTWIGGSKASSMRMHAAVEPAVAGAVWFALDPFGFDMPDMPAGLRSLDLGQPQDLDQARAFASAALDHLAPFTPERLGDISERSLARAAAGGEATATYLAMAPGWRVVLGNASPVDAVEVLVRRRPADPDRPPTFLDELIAAWEAGGREEALAYMAERRDASLAEQGYGPEATVS